MSKLDIEGEYVPCGGTFYKYPIPINRETSMVLVRKASHCVLVYLALVSRLIPVVMHGLPSTASALIRIVEELEGSLDRRLDAVETTLSSFTPEDASAHQDLISAVSILGKNFKELNPTLDTATPSAVLTFVEYIGQVFTPLPGELNSGCILVSTVHAL